MTVVPRRRRGRARQLDEAWWDFHEANPWVLQFFLDELREAIHYKDRRVPIDFLIYLVRREGRRTRRTDEFKINQNHASRYARYIAHHYPQFKHLFVLKPCEADGFNPRRRPV